MFSTTDPIELIKYLVSTSDLEILREWRDLTEKERLSVLPIIGEGISFAKKTMYRNVVSLLENNKLPVSPLQALLITQQINKSKSKADLDNFFRHDKITPVSYQLSVVKPLAINSIDALVKLYLCVSYEDAYLYVQVAKILRNYDINKLVRQRQNLTIAHENIANLLQWYRVARSMSKGFFEGRNEKTISKYPEDEELYPSVDLVVQTVNNTVAIIEEMKIFPDIILKMLRETTNISNLFLTVDALYVTLENEFRGQEIKVRHKLALLYLVRDIIDDSAVWTSMTV